MNGQHPDERRIDSNVPPALDKFPKCHACGQPLDVKVEADGTVAVAKTPAPEDMVE